MITKRDREIINFIYDFGFITIEQCSKIFFNQSVSSYDLARRRLKKIAENNNYIKSKLNSETKQLLYIPKESTIKGISKHDLLVIDYLAELNSMGAEVENCFIEKNYDGVIPDALLIFTLGGYRFYQLLEVQLRHDIVNISRYLRVMDKILLDTNNVIPKIVIIQDTKKDYNKDNNTDIEVLQLKTNLEDIAKVLV